MPDPGVLGILGEVGAEAMPSALFVTDFDRAFLRVLEVHAINYLLLPLDEERFQTIFARALRQSEGRALAGVRRRLGRMLAADEAGSRERRIPVRNAGETHYVDLDDIRWVEGFGTLARLHLDDRTHVVKAELSELAEGFADDFVRIHSVLVRTSEIAEIELTSEGDSVVKFRDGRQIRVSRSSRPVIVRA
jgi:two-component system LytT family response regulator